MMLETLTPHHFTNAEGEDALAASDEFVDLVQVASEEHVKQEIADILLKLDELDEEMRKTDASNTLLLLQKTDNPLVAKVKALQSRMKIKETNGEFVTPYMWSKAIATQFYRPSTFGTLPKAMREWKTRRDELARYGEIGWGSLREYLQISRQKDEFDRDYYITPYMWINGIDLTLNDGRNPKLFLRRAVRSLNRAKNVILSQFISLLEQEEGGHVAWSKKGPIGHPGFVSEPLDMPRDGGSSAIEDID